MTATLPQAAPAVADRFGLAFSRNGHHGVSLATGPGDGVTLERWQLTGHDAVRRTVPDVAVDRGADALPLDDGRILLARGSGPTSSGSRRHQLAVLAPDRDECHLERLGEIPARFGGRLLAGPGSTALGFFVTADDQTSSTIWRLQASPAGVEPVVRVPGSLSGGVWLNGDPDGDRAVLAVNQIGDGHGCSGIAVDIAQGSWRRIWSASDASTDRIVCYSPRSGLFVVTTTLSGEERLGLGTFGEGTVRFPDVLRRPGYVRKVLALDDGGLRLLVHETCGTLSRLFIYHPDDDGLELLSCPQGVVSSPVSWTGEVIRARFSAPDQPPTVATARLATTPLWSMGRDRGGGSRPARAQAELIELPGAAGPVEAIVYGGAGWRHRRHLVMALHGGPLSAWRFEFTPLFQSLAAAGVAVVAPNHRGSTGYGDEHLRAVIGNWGGADLDDVLTLGRHLAAQRRHLQLPGPVVLGASYGAFLALLAACHEPTLWSACVAAAPFLSGTGLHEDAPSAIRGLIEELGGRRPMAPGIAARDVLRDCASLSVPLLLIHGAGDAAVPVGQSRALRRRLLELGRTEGTDFEYLETDGDHGDVVSVRRDALRRRIVRFCVARSGLDGSRPTGPAGGRRGDEADHPAAVPTILSPIAERR
jgi:dipeptidyl aminopeptidase/acylaminoacyl peptidase